MKYMKIKAPEGYVEISKLVLGTDYFGTNVSKDISFQLMDRFFDAGGNCLDTARLYAEWLPGGKDASEGTIGEWLKNRSNRNKILISTKGGHPPRNRMEEGRLDRKSIESDLNDSLKVLGVDHIDLYWLHRDDIKRPVEDIMTTMHSLVTSGKIRVIGCSNWSIDRIEKANAFAETNSLTPFCVSQIQWSLAASNPDLHKDPTLVCMDEKQYEWYVQKQLPVMAFSSQAKGFFTRAAAGGLEAINNKALVRFCSPENILRLERVKEYASNNNLTPSSATLGYITCNKLPAMAIVGCKNIEQLEDSLTAADVTLNNATVDWLFRG